MIMQALIGGQPRKIRCVAWA